MAQKTTRQPETRGMLIGVASCAVFALSAFAFLFFARKLGRWPVARGGFQDLGPYSDFLRFWTRNFFGAAALGIGLGAWGRSTRAGLVGLVLNGLSLAVLLLLTSTAG